MKRILGIALLAVMAMSVSAHAAINLSRHDMGAMGGGYAALAGVYGDCSACHVPHKAQGAKLWPVTPPAYATNFGLVGRLCAKCHDGVTLAAALSANLSYGPYSAPAGGLAGHSLNVTLVPDIPKVGSGVAAVEASGLPHTAAADRNPAAPWGGNYMECTSCHDVHNAGSNRPFLTVANIGTLCQACHTGRINNALYGALNASGLHPVNNTGTIDTDEGANGANPILAGMGQIALTAGTGLAADASAWNSGQHAYLGGIYCTSCHVIHGDEPTGYAEDGTAPQGIYDSALLFNLQVPAANTRNQFCEACHQGDNTNQAGGAGELPNPGDTPAGIGGGTADVARTWHPADAGLENAAGRIVAITEPAGWPFAGGANGRVICTSCHMAHGGSGTTMTNSPMLRNTAAAAPYNSFCMDCHTTVNFDCFHSGHLAGDGSGGTLAAMAPAGLGTAWGTPPASGLDCNVCHKAHNTTFVPILRFGGGTSANPDSLCTTCHTINPSTFTTAAPSGAAQSLASHFVGNVTLAAVAGGVYETDGYGIAAGQVDALVPEKITAWPVGELSIYGGTLTAAGRGDMTCLSCHSLRYCGEGGANTRGMTGDGNSNWMIITASGNEVDQPNPATDVYICSGCHGNDPITRITGGETGFTHPTYTATVGVEAPKGGWGMSKSANGRVNCESCHRPHDADTNAGTYILESDGAGTGITGAGTGVTIMPAHAHDVFCNGCHTK